MVRYSAIGYITQDISDITINNGQTTTQDVTLEPAGNPPTNLIATQGAGLQVDLSFGKLLHRQELLDIIFTGNNILSNITPPHHWDL